MDAMQLISLFSNGCYAICNFSNGSWSGLHMVQRYPTCLQIAIQLLLYLEVTSNGDCLLLQKQIGLLINLISLHAQVASNCKEWLCLSLCD